jgi:hypothetical protein
VIVVIFVTSERVLRKEQEVNGRNGDRQKEIIKKESKELKSAMTSPPD